MRLIVKATRLGGRLVRARFVSDAVISSPAGRDPVLVVSGRTIPLNQVRHAEYEILEATEAELRILQRSGCGDTTRSLRPPARSTPGILGSSPNTSR